MGLPSIHCFYTIDGHGSPSCIVRQSSTGNRQKLTIEQATLSCRQPHRMTIHISQPYTPDVVSKQTVVLYKALKGGLMRL